MNVLLSFMNIEDEGFNLALDIKYAGTVLEQFYIDY